MRSTAWWRWIAIFGLAPALTGHAALAAAEEDVDARLITTLIRP